MERMDRRTVLCAAMSSFPMALLGQSVKAPAQRKIVPVAAGKDRFGEERAIGVSLTQFKVSSEDSQGGLFIMESRNGKKGGPPRHIHRNEDEWFYVVEGEYLFEVGQDRFLLKAGDSVLGPRNVTHVWAFVGNTAGRLLLAFTPANRMEEFFRAPRPRGGYFENRSELPREHGIEIVGPPLRVD